MKMEKVGATRTTAATTGYETGYKAGCAVAAGCSVDNINDTVCTGIGNIDSLVVKRDHYNFSTGFNAGYSDTNNAIFCSTSGAMDTPCLGCNLCCIL